MVFSLCRILTIALVCASHTSILAVQTDYLQLAQEYVARAQESASIDSTIYYYRNAAELFETYEQWEELVNCLNELVILTIDEGEIEQAMLWNEQATKTATEHLGDKHLSTAKSYDAGGHLLYETHEFEQSLENYNRSLAIKQSILPPEHFEIGHSHVNISRIYRNQKRFFDSLSHLDIALDIYRRAFGEIHTFVASAYNYLALLYKDMRDIGRAISYNKKTIGIYEQLEHVPISDIVTGYGNLALSYMQLGDNRSASKYLHKVLEKELEIFGEDHPRLARTYYNLGLVHRRRADYDKSIEFYNKVLSILTEAYGDSHPFIPRTYSNIGAAFLKKGDYKKAGKYFHAVIESTDTLSTDQKFFRSNVYTNLGLTYSYMGNHGLALKYQHKALNLKKEIFDADLLNVADAYTNLAVAHYFQKTHQEAKSYLRIALDIYSRYATANIPTWSTAHKQMGNVFRQIAEYDSALTHYQKAMDIYLSDVAEIPNNPEIVDILIAKAGTLVDKYYNKSNNPHDLEAAVSTFQTAIDVIEYIRTGYTTERAKLHFGKDIHAIADKAIQAALLLDEIQPGSGYRKKAYNFAEMSRAAVLRQTMHDAGARSLAGIPDSLLSREATLQAELAYYRIEREKEHETEELRRHIHNRYFSLLLEHQRLIELFEKEYPQYHDMKYNNEYVSPAGLQASLDNSTAVLQFFMGDSLMHVFSITENVFDIHTMPVSAKVDSLAHIFISSIRRFDHDNYRQSGRALYSLLIQPSENIIQEYREMVIIPDGILHYLPFEALPVGRTEDITPEHENDHTNLEYFITNHTVVYQNSATLYVNAIQVKGDHIYDHDFAGFAPVFDDKEDGYIVTTDTGVDTQMDISHVLRSIELEGRWFAPLPNSKKEVQSILALFNSNHLPATAFFHSRATDAALRSLYDRYRIIHIASHGFINETNPDLSGLLFAQANPENNTEINVLYAGEMYTLDIKADLMILSSCESGIGDLIRGEGLLAFTRGLLYSGIQNVIVSLWKVFDEPTKNLMVNFYKHVIAGHEYASALRKAKLSMIADPSTAFPHYWSSFILIGT